MPFVSSYDSHKSYGGSSSFPRSYGGSSSYSSYRSSWDRPSSLYSNSELSSSSSLSSSYSKSSYLNSVSAGVSSASSSALSPTTPSVSSYISSRSANNVSGYNANSASNGSSYTSWRDSLKSYNDTEKPSRFQTDDGHVSRPSSTYSWRENLAKLDSKPSAVSSYRSSQIDEKPSYTSWRDSLKSSSVATTSTAVTATTTTTTTTSNSSLLADARSSYNATPSWRANLEAATSSAGALDDRNGRNLERRSSKKEGALGYDSALQRTLERSTNISERIEQTLSKHNVPAPQETWRTRERSTARTSDTPTVDTTKCKFLQDRGTSCAEEEDRYSRIGRDTEPYSIRLTRYVKPRTEDVALQTEQYYLKDRKKSDEEGFDYFDHVKKTMQYIANNPTEKQKLDKRIEAFQSAEEKREEKYVIKKAPMSGLLPGTEPVEPEKSAYAANAQSGWHSSSNGYSSQGHNSTGVSETDSSHQNGYQSAYGTRSQGLNSSAFNQPSASASSEPSTNSVAANATESYRSKSRPQDAAAAARMKKENPLGYLDMLDLDSDDSEPGSGQRGRSTAGQAKSAACDKSSNDALPTAAANANGHTGNGMNGSAGDTGSSSTSTWGYYSGWGNTASTYNGAQNANHAEEDGQEVEEVAAEEEQKDEEHDEEEEDNKCDGDTKQESTAAGDKVQPTFIGGAMDIDDLLCGPSHMFGYNPSPVAFEHEGAAASGYKDLNGYGKQSKLLDDKPWWETEKAEDKAHVKTDPEKDEMAEDGEEEEEEEEEEGEEEADEGEGDEEEEEEDEEGEEEEEDEDEWEYYTDEEEEEEGDVKYEEAKEELDSTAQDKSEEKRDLETKEWILEGIEQLIPRIPTAPTPRHPEGSDDGEDEEDNGLDVIDEEDALLSPHGYRDWLMNAAGEIGGQSAAVMAVAETAKQAVEAADVEDSEKGGSAEVDEIKAKAVSIVDKLKNADGSELKQVLFGLKAFFQSDTNLVFEFIESGGLETLVELADTRDESQLQNFILRALGQLMLYVDGMKGVMDHIGAVELLYKMVCSENKLVVKTAIKLLLVFIDYKDTNYEILLQAIQNVADENEEKPWKHLVDLMTRGVDDPRKMKVKSEADEEDKDNEEGEAEEEGGQADDEANEGINLTSDFDSELCTFALTLINKTLYEVDDQSMFYDQTDHMEDLGIDSITSLTTDDGITNTLLEEIQLYNVTLKQEDGDQVTEDDISALYQDASLRLRTSARSKSGNKPRKSLRYRIRQVKTAETDQTGDIPDVGYNDLKKILTKSGLQVSPSGDSLNQMTGLTGFLLKVKDAFLAKIGKGETGASPVPPPDSPECDEREGETQWNKIVSTTDRPLIICDLDFSDLKDEEAATDDRDGGSNQVGAGAPPAPPPLPPPMPPSVPAPPPLPPNAPAPLPMVPKDKTLTPATSYRKTKKTIKLFWRELRQSYIDSPNSQTVWDDLVPVTVDHKVLEYLFESRGKESIVKENNKTPSMPLKEIVVLDHKRSNFINIGMTKLPPPRIIKESVMRMDSTIINKEGIEKLLTMLPSAEEISRIEEAQESTPELPLGTAEQFLITLSSISCLEARLRLWAFKLDFVALEKEICEPLGDLKQGLEILKNSVTFNAILSVILEIGNFLNGTSSKGFQIDYLAKIPEVKDTVHKHSMLYHLTFWLLEAIPNLSDLYSEIGPITRASKTDFEEVTSTLTRMEEECKNSWDYLKIINKFDGSDGDQSASGTGNALATSASASALSAAGTVAASSATGGLGRNSGKVADFLVDAAERIIVMQKVNKIMRYKFVKFLQWLGIPKSQAHEYKVHHVCKTISEFALEFRTSRERAQQTLKFKREAKDRNRSRAKLNEMVKMSSRTELNLLLEEGLTGMPRKKKKHREHREHRERRRRTGEEGAADGEDRHRHHRHRHRNRPEEDGQQSAQQQQAQVVTSPEASRCDDDSSRSVRRRRTRPKPDEEGGAAAAADPSGRTERPRRHRAEEEDGDVNDHGEPEDVIVVKNFVEHRRRRRKDDGLVTDGNEERRIRHKKKVSRNVAEPTVELMDGQSVPEKEMDAGLLESLMDIGRVTLRRNADRRRSTKHRDSPSLRAELMRSRTRENNVMEQASGEDY